MTNMIGTFGGMRSKMQSLSKMMKAGGGGGARSQTLTLNPGTLNAPRPSQHSPVSSPKPLNRDPKNTVEPVGDMQPAKKNLYGTCHGRRSWACLQCHELSSVLCPQAWV